MATHITFDIEPVKKDRKTRTWLVHGKDNGIPLGRISWWGAWRCYVFFPFMDTLYEKTCLRDIADFTEQKSKEVRASWRK